MFVSRLLRFGELEMFITYTYLSVSVLILWHYLRLLFSSLRKDKASFWAFMIYRFELEWNKNLRVRYFLAVGLETLQRV